MGQLFPEDFPLDQLANDAERAVVEAFCDQLLDSWYVIPDVGMRAPDRDRQTDIVLLHHDLGIVLIEVKGHRMSIRDGVWVGQEGTPLKPQPIDQAKGNAYELRRRLRKEIPGLEHLEVEYGVALPNTRSIEGDLPPEVIDAQVLIAPDLTEANDAIETLALSRRYSRPLDREQMEGIVNHLCPDCRLRLGPRGPGHRHPPAPPAAVRRADRRAQAARPEPAGRRARGSGHRQDPPRPRLGPPGLGRRRPGAAHLLQRAARRGAAGRDARPGRRGPHRRRLHAPRPRAARHAAAARARRRRRRLVGQRRHRAPPQVLAAHRHRLRHDRRRRGPGLQPRLARPAPGPARPRRPPPDADGRRRGPGHLRARLPLPRPRRRLGAGRARLQLPQRGADRPHPAPQARRCAGAGDVTRGAGRRVASRPTRWRR